MSEIRGLDQKNFKVSCNPLRAVMWDVLGIVLYSLGNDDGGDSNRGCPTFWCLWATLEEEELSWATH